LPSGDSFDLWRFCEARCRRLARLPSMVFAGGSVTFEELFRTAQLLAAELTKSGIRESTIVAVILPNSAFFAPTVLGLFKLGATVALVSPKCGFGELQAIREGIHPDFLLCTGAFAIEHAAHLGVTRTEPITCSPLLKNLAVGRWSRSESAVTVPGTAVVKITSGSAAAPKAIPLSSANVVTGATTVVETLNCTPVDRILCVTPMCHSYAFDLGVLTMLASGASLVIHDAFVPRQVLRDIAALNVSILLGVPSMYRTFVDLRLAAVPDLSRVRYLLSCTAPLSPQTITAFCERFHAPICQHYGSSETGAVAMHIRDEVRNRPNSVGKAMRGVTIQIVDADGAEVPIGNEGEIAVTSAAVGMGYLMGRPNGPSPFNGASFRMGDRGLMDRDGFLNVTGRMDDMINVGGFKVSPLEVTHALQRCSKVREVAVLGVKDPCGESAVYAAVTLTGPATEQELLTFCRTQLADYKVPRRIEILKDLPRGSSGKIRIRPEDVSL
jgi:long-chain acyl-CoA synthetase